MGTLNCGSWRHPRPEAQPPEQRTAGCQALPRGRRPQGKEGSPLVPQEGGRAGVPPRPERPSPTRPQRPGAPTCTQPGPVHPALGLGPALGEQLRAVQDSGDLPLTPGPGVLFLPWTSWSCLCRGSICQPHHPRRGSPHPTLRRKMQEPEPEGL